MISSEIGTKHSPTPLNKKTVFSISQLILRETTMMSKRQQLRRSINVLLNQEKHGSFSTRSTRKRNLLIFADAIFKVNMPVTDIRQLKAKHIEKVVSYWLENELNIGTIKNRMAAIRFMCTCIGTEGMIKNNDALGIGKRSYASTFNRAHHNPDFSRITDPFIKISLELQRVFGLRREEAMKIKPHIADKEHTLMMLPPWCKGNRGRFIPINTEEQRFWLEEAKRIVGKFGNSMIPVGKRLSTQLKLYEKQCERANLHNMHGLRHAYAQRIYKELTGWDAPINGGPKVAEMTKEQKAIDHAARMVLTESLGHGRKSVVRNYCA
jgi:site-specific recombinase XerD